MLVQVSDANNKAVKDRQDDIQNILKNLKVIEILTYLAQDIKILPTKKYVNMAKSIIEIRKMLYGRKS